MAPGFGDLPSGLPDDYVLTIRTARATMPFKNDENAQNPDSVMAQFIGEQKQEDGDLEDADLRLGVGDFEPGDKEGTFLIHATSQDPKKRISGNSKYGKFFKSAVKAGVPLEEKQAQLGRQEYMEKDMLMWEGAILRVHVEEEEFTLRKGPEAGKVVKTRQPVVTEFLGWADGSGEGASGATSTTTEAPNPASNGWNAEVAAAKAKSFIEYVEDATTNHGIDPSDERLTKKFFTDARA